MTMPVPARPKIYHIVHVDRLKSIMGHGCIWSDAEVARRAPPGTTIGMSDIKQRRLAELTLASHPGLYVGSCVPFYFCPRSVMLFLLYKRNHPGLNYTDGQDPIVHLESDLLESVDWANQNHRRWAFTLSNAGARYFEDRCNLSQLDEIDWDAVEARNWQQRKEGKQAEFLIEGSFPWELVERVGVRSQEIYRKVSSALPVDGHRPRIEILKDWYY